MRCLLQGERYTGTSKGRTKGLDLELPLYIGGIVKESVKLHSDVGVQQGFNGCVAHVSISIQLMKSVDQRLLSPHTRAFPANVRESIHPLG